MVTSRLAGSCHKVYGVDFSEINIGVARTYFQVENVAYVCADALTVDSLFRGLVFDKVVCYGGLQYFCKREGKELVSKICHVMKPGGRFFLGDIPDAERRKNYYVTFYRRFRVLLARIKRRIDGLGGQDSFGWWWRRNELEEIAKDLSMEFSPVPRSQDLKSSRYRMDVLFKKVR